MRLVWQGRFRCQQLTDEAALLACCIYVDLNPLRVGLAHSLATARYTSIYDRLRADNARKARSGETPSSSASPVRAADLEADAWLRPLELDPRARPPEGPSQSGWRLSDRGFLEISLERYCELAEWTWRNHKKEPPEVIPEHLQSLVRRNGILPEQWGKVTEHYGSWFGRCVGRPASMVEVAESQNNKWLPGIARCRQVFCV